MTANHHRRSDAGQLSLFGDDNPPAPAAVPAGRVSDEDLIEAVGRTAQHPGYVVLGRSEHVYLRDSGTHCGRAVTRVPHYENETVHQLVNDGVLKIGRTVTVMHEGQDLRAAIVVMPKHVRPTFDKWTRGRQRQRRTGGAGSGQSAQGRDAEAEPDPRARVLINVDVVRRGVGLVTTAAGDFSGVLTRSDGRYLVETECGDVIGHARSYRTGAAVLARHHGYTAGPVEISHEKDPT